MASPTGKTGGVYRPPILKKAVAKEPRQTPGIVPQVRKAVPQEPVQGGKQMPPSAGGAAPTSGARISPPVQMDSGKQDTGGQAPTGNPQFPGATVNPTGYPIAPTGNPQTPGATINPTGYPGMGSQNQSFG